MSFLELKIPPVAILLICITGMASAQVYLPPIGLSWSVSIIMASIFLTIGLTIIMLAVWVFRRHKTTVNPFQPELSSELLTTGVMRISRNPMYLGFVCLIIASGFALQSIIFPFVAAIFIFYTTRFQIIPEERSLNALFPLVFSEYCKKSRRWI